MLSLLKIITVPAVTEEDLIEYLKNTRFNEIQTGFNNGINKGETTASYNYIRNLLLQTRNNQTVDNKTARMLQNLYDKIGQMHWSKIFYNGLDKTQATIEDISKLLEKIIGNEKIPQKTKLDCMKGLKFLLLTFNNYPESYQSDKNYKPLFQQVNSALQKVNSVYLAGIENENCDKKNTSSHHILNETMHVVQPGNLENITDVHSNNSLKSIADKNETDDDDDGLSVIVEVGDRTIWQKISSFPVWNFILLHPGRWRLPSIFRKNNEGILILYNTETNDDANTHAEVTGTLTHSIINSLYNINSDEKYRRQDLLKQNNYNMHNSKSNLLNTNISTVSDILYPQKEVHIKEEVSPRNNYCCSNLMSSCTNWFWGYASYWLSDQDVIQDDTVNKHSKKECLI